MWVPSKNELSCCRGYMDSAYSVKNKPCGFNKLLHLVVYSARRFIVFDL